jgi:hypothetical protein
MSLSTKALKLKNHRFRIKMAILSSRYRTLELAVQVLKINFLNKLVKMPQVLLVKVWAVNDS